MKAQATANLLADSILADEIELETKAVADGIARYHELAREAIKRGEGSGLKPVDRLLLHWYEPLRDEIRKIRRRAARGKNETGAGIWGEQIQYATPEELATITLHTTINFCLDHEHGAGYAKVAYAIGAAILAEENWRVLKKKNKEKATELRQSKRMNISYINRWAKKYTTESVWSRHVAIHLGARLLWALIETASVHEPNEPYKLAFVVRNIRRGRKTHKRVLLSTKALDIIEAGHAARQGMRPRYLPMVVQPYPWSKDAQGGYVKIRTPFIAKPTREQKAALDNANLEPIFTRLSALTAPAWRINRRVYDVASKIRKSGGGVLDIPGNEKLAKPSRPADYDTNEEAKKEWRRAAVQIHKANIRLAAERRNIDYKLRIAEMMLDYPAIYFPHQLDFRGRAYPIPAHLNHHGDDLCRGLLECGESVPLGDKGEYWLRVQAATAFGLDKEPFEERLAWTDANAGNINRVASDPLGTVDWWGKADTPWQFLAACYALDGDGTRLLTDADGTCNGLQWYAALGRDAEGAKLVNLSPSDRPQSVYQAVADGLAPIVIADAGSVRAAEIVVRMIDSGAVTWRKLVKQPTMTHVYDVTDSGVRNQQRLVLRKAGLTNREDLREVIGYLVTRTTSTVERICVAASRIMAWMKDCGRLIVKTGESIRWTTPLGFPVVQPYRHFAAVTITTHAGQLQDLRDDGEIPIKIRRQLNGFAPNIIHCFDKSHMFNAVLAAREDGIWLAAIHDAYRSPAGTREAMNIIVPREFVALNERPLLDLLLAEWRQTYPGIDFPEPPARGTFNIREVLKSPYAFS